MSQRDGCECVLLPSAMCHPDHCIAFQRKCSSEASLEKIEFIHQYSGGLQVCVAHFTLGFSEKRTSCKAREVYLSLLYFFIRINEERVHCHDLRFKHLEPHWIRYHYRLQSQTDPSPSSDFCDFWLGNWNCCSWRVGGGVHLAVISAVQQEQIETETGER